MVERYDFTLIKNNKDRTRVIDEFCQVITNGNFSASETMQLRNDLVRDYLESCSVGENKDDTTI